MGLVVFEFRLPVLISLFKFHALEAVILNKIMSLVVVFFAFFFRLFSISINDILSNYMIIINILLGSIIGAYLGADIAIKIKTTTLYKIISKRSKRSNRFTRLSILLRSDTIACVRYELLFRNF